jgi:hypothetical protein
LLDFQLSCTIPPMNEARTDAGGTTAVGFCDRPLWVLPLLALLALQSATTLTLFDPQRSTQPLLDDGPILDGLHPLHLDHGLLGAQSWREGGFGCCYDPAFQAGYPKTPVFDSGSRPAELFLLLGRDHVAAYKIGLALCCAVVPLIFALAARLLDLGPGAACFAAVLGVLAWWSGPVQRLLASGQLDWLLAGEALVLHAALAVRFHSEPRPRIWLGLLLSATLGWFLHPILWLGLGLIFVPFYVCLATRHCLIWNTALLCAWTGGLLVNIGWLGDWVKNWWIQAPLSQPSRAIELSELADWFRVEVGGGQADGLLALVLLGGGLLGVLGLMARRRFAAGLTFGATALLLPALALGGSLWKPLEAIATSKFFVLGCAFATVPCAAAGRDGCHVLGRLLGHPVRGQLLGLLCLAGAIYALRDDVVTLSRQAQRAQPLHVGFTPEQQALIRTFRATTRPDARILWEERPDHPEPAWTALLPRHTDRAFLGGLGPEVGVDHAYARLTPTHLAGRPLTQWSDAELTDFCTRYNIGYVAAWTPAVAARFRAWPAAELVTAMHESGDGWLFALNRTGSYILKGRARIVQLDAGRIVLADLEPEDGVVVLSLHYQSGFRIIPSTVRAEREPDPDDPIPRLRLHLPGPVLRVTLTWGKP